MEKQESIFDIRLNNPGRASIRQFASRIILIIILTIIIALIHIASCIYFANSCRLRPPAETLGKIICQFYIYYTLIYSVLVIFQLACLKKLAVLLRKTLQKNDEESFNRSFALLARYATISVIIMAFSILSYGLELYSWTSGYYK